MHSSLQYALGAINAGASGYLLKDSAFEEMARSIHAVAGGRLYLSPQVEELVAKECGKKGVSNRISRFCRLIGLTSPG